MGLFLLLKDRYGEEAIREVIRKLETYDTINEKELFAVFNQTLKTDIEKLVADFRFPDMGFDLKQHSQDWLDGEAASPHRFLRVTRTNKDGLAHRAGIQEHDLLVSLNDRPCTYHLEFELALLEAAKEKQVFITILRNGEKKTFILTINENAMLRSDDFEVVGQQRP